MKDLSNPQFDNLSTFLQNFIDTNVTAGISILVYHKNKIVYRKKFGWQDKENQISMEFDTIHRIYSMTKPVATFALMTLWDEGKFLLDDPISKYIPEFAKVKVLKTYDQETGEFETEEPKTPITIRHLATHSAGLPYGLLPLIPGEQLYLKMYDKIVTKPSDALGRFFEFGYLKNEISQLSKVPLLYHPGEQSWYSLAIDVLGYLIEILSGMELDEFLNERILKPLNMKDTDVYVPKDKLHRFAKSYTTDESGNLILLTGLVDKGYQTNPKYISAGGGLVSTLDDYFNFTKMLLDKGKYEGKRILSEEAIELATQNLFDDGKTTIEKALIKPKDQKLIELFSGFGAGFGFSVKVAKNKTPSGIGTHGWGGAMNSYYWVDPKNQVICVMMTQRLPKDLLWIHEINLDVLKQQVYDALEGCELDLI